MSHDKACLHDIVESFERAMDDLGPLTVHELSADPQKQDAIIRRIEIIGEAPKRLSQAIGARCPISNEGRRRVSLSKPVPHPVPTPTPTINAAADGPLIRRRPA